MGHGGAYSPRKSALLTIQVADPGNASEAVAAAGTVDYFAFEEGPFPTADSTVVVNGRTYTLVAEATATLAADSVRIDEDDNSVTFTRLASAIDMDDSPGAGANGVGGDYNVATANADVLAVDNGTGNVILTALVAGAAGNSLTLSKTGSNLSVTAFQNGADAELADAGTLGQIIVSTQSDKAWMCVSVDVEGVVWKQITNA